MPYAQMHYPFENRERFDKGFPADFIAEGLDQTRGWFYTLMVLSTALFDKPAFKNLIVNGLVLASDGKKMSKRLKNYPDPVDVVNKYGADALRLYLINSPVVRADSLKFQEPGVSDVVKGVLLPWFNAFRFFIQCVERWEQQTSPESRRFVPSIEYSKSSTNDVDIWILAASMGLVKFVHQEMQAYRLYTVVPRLVGFIEELTNWYVRLNRDRLKGSLGDEEALLGLNVLYEVMLTMSIIMAPFTPFFSEYLYQHLRKFHSNYNNNDENVPVDALGKGVTVHCLSLPAVDESRINSRAESRFKTLQEAVCLARVARERRHIRNNLPLKDVLVVAANPDDIEALTYLKPYFMGEINSWEVTLSSDWQQYCSVKANPNWKDLGKRLGKDMKSVAKVINEMTADQLIQFMNDGSMTVCGHVLTTEDVVVKRQFSGDNKKYEACVSEDGTLIVAIDTTFDDTVFEELRARLIASLVQRARKSTGLVVTDSVEVFYDEQDGDSVKNALATHANATVKRIKTYPLPISLMPSGAIKKYEEDIDDSDLGKKPVKLVLTLPCVSVDFTAVEKLGVESSLLPHVGLYLQSMEYNSLLSKERVTVKINGIDITVERGVHYFATANEMVKSSQELQLKYNLSSVNDF